jgi:hypothetical protein
MEAAKMIRFTSVAGSKLYKFGTITCEDVHTARDRKNDSLHVDFFASIDCIYLAGAEAAPDFKKMRKEYYSFKCVSRNSPVGGHANEYLIESDTKTVIEEKDGRTYNRFYVNL